MNLLIDNHRDAPDLVKDSVDTGSRGRVAVAVAVWAANLAESETPQGAGAESQSSCSKMRAVFRRRRPVAGKKAGRAAQYGSVGGPTLGWDGVPGFPARSNSTKFHTLKRGRTWQRSPRLRRNRYNTEAAESDSQQVSGLLLRER